MSVKIVSGILFITIGLALFASAFSIAPNRIEQDLQITGINWLSGWTYRKAHNITGSSAGVQVNYPVMVNVRYSNGYDSEGEVYLNQKCRLDFGDVRFTDSSGANELSYWIQNSVNGVQALFWLSINYISQSPDRTTIYIYYGNPNASTMSNKDWTLSSASDFEDGTAEGWTISWQSGVTFDGISNLAYAGNYSRCAGRGYGTSNSGVGEFFEHFLKSSVYLSAGVYYMEGSAKFEKDDGWMSSREIDLRANGAIVASVSYPGVTWHRLGGNFTISTSSLVELDVELHLSVATSLISAEIEYYVDDLFVRKWCQPEPSHSLWGVEEAVSIDSTPPEISSVQWLPTRPDPLVPSSTPRQTEPVLVLANVSDEVIGSGIDWVHLVYQVNQSAWCNTTMTFNSTSSLWGAIIPGQPGNTTVVFCILARDNAGNVAQSPDCSFDVEALSAGDINGDGTVDSADLGIIGVHWGEIPP